MQEKFEKYSDQWLVKLYLENRSVEAMYLADTDIPFSPAEIHRRLRKMGIVRSAGRHTDFWEAIEFFASSANCSTTSLEKVLRRMPRAQASLVSLHRIAKRIKDGVFVRKATALFVENNGQILLGREGGLLTIPMTYSRIVELPVESICRVLQQEVLSSQAISGCFSESGYFRRATDGFEKVFDFGVLDVLVSCYKLNLVGASPNSIRLDNLKFYSKKMLETETCFRPGVKELTGYFLNNYKTKRLIVSSLNLNITKMAPSY